MHKSVFSDEPNIHVQRGAFLLTALIIGILLGTISDPLSFGPKWTILSIEGVLFVPMVISIYVEHHGWSRIISLSITGVVTFGLVFSVSFFIHSLFMHTASAASLFRSAGLLWLANIGVFAAWYWEIDGGGPHKRYGGKNQTPDFLFPQASSAIPGWEKWTPLFMDYLFLAFNTNTAFSPTDTLVLSKKAKFLMMIQSSISLLIVSVLAARAINIA